MVVPLFFACLQSRAEPPMMFIPLFYMQLCPKQVLDTKPVRYFPHVKKQEPKPNPGGNGATTDVLHSWYYDRHCDSEDSVTNKLRPSIRKLLRHEERKLDNASCSSKAMARPMARVFYLSQLTTIKMNQLAEHPHR